MTENAKIPAAQNPSNAVSPLWESAWKVFNHIQFIVTYLPKNTYEQAIQDKLQDIQQNCSSMYVFGYGQGFIVPSDAAKQIAPLVAQLQASAGMDIAEMAGFIGNPCKDMATLASSSGM